MKEQIQEILDIIKPVWRRSGHFTDQDISELTALGFYNLKESYYDGKILKFSYKEIDCYFTKFMSDYFFKFKDGIKIHIFENYTYGGDLLIYNDSEQEEDFLNKTSLDITPFTVNTCYDNLNKIIIYSTKLKTL